MNSLCFACRATLILGAVLSWSGAAWAQNPPPDAGASDVAAPQDTAPPTAEAPAREAVPPADAATPPPPRRRHHRRHQEAEPAGPGSDILWFGAELGLSVVDLKMISYDQLLPREVDVRENGLGFGAVAGLRLKILSVGLHLAVGQFSEFDVWAINLDGQLRIPLGFVEPYLRLGIGYAFLGSFQGTDLDGVTVNGWDAQLGFGIDLYPVTFFSIGAGADFTILNLSRTDSITSVDLLQDGAAVGVAVWLQAKAALHF